MFRCRLSEKQLNELELLLAGAYGENAFYSLPSETDDVISTLQLNGTFAPGDSLELVDSEGTVLATVQVDSSRNSAADTWVSGHVKAVRRFGHRTLAEHRVTGVQSIAGPMVLITGNPSPANNPTWSTLDAHTVVVVVDSGNPAQTAQRFASLPTHLQRHALVMPSPAAAHLAESDLTELLCTLLVNLLGVEVSVMSGDARGGNGVVVLFSGLSGSGKSTIAKALADRLRLTDTRRTTLLDGDEVREMLSSGLGFDRADREMNVRRIGWVAATVAEHGGIAICAPIAPYDSMRSEVRTMAQAHGRFILVHVATPLEVCEARDRKGLYALARQGKLAQFTGISDPYEIPEDADIVVDTTNMGVDECVDIVMMEIARS